MNQKELVRELREMHQQTLQQLQLITDALVKLAEQRVVVQTGPASMDRPRHYGSAETPQPVVQMDESVYVTKVDTSTIEKGYEEIAKTESTEDTSLSKTKDKLRALKNRS